MNWDIACQRASEFCGVHDAQILAQVENGFAALAVSPAGWLTQAQYGGGIGATAEQACNEAVQRCGGNPAIEIVVSSEEGLLYQA